MAALLGNAMPAMVTTIIVMEMSFPRASYTSDETGRVKKNGHKWLALYTC